MRRNRIYFEGGLGSQLLGALTFFKLESEIQITCDFSYFEHQHASANPNLSFWNWQLDEYGYKKENFPTSKFLLTSKTRKLHEIKVNQILLSEIYEANYADRFPISSQFNQLKTELHISNDEEYACVHIRQGDYIKVASRVIPLNETLGVMSTILEILPKRIFIISDSAFSSREKQIAKEVLKNIDIEFIVGGNENAIHGLMRSARILITSNSTYSFSAMLLANRNQIAITPNNFHGEKNLFLNSSFVLQKSWSLNSMSRKTIEV